MSSPSAPTFAYHDNKYVSRTGRGTITRSNSFGRPGGDSSSPSDYPSTLDMVRWIEGPVERRNTTDEAYAYASYDDRLWMLSCGGAREEEGRRSRVGYGGTGVLRDLFDMGQFQWADRHKPSPVSLRAFRFTSAMGQELLRRIEGTETKVGTFSIILISLG